MLAVKSAEARCPRCETPCRRIHSRIVFLLRLFLEERGFPADERFQRAFVTYDLYHSAYARPVLLELESVISRGHKEPPDLKDATVEHVMPQTLTDAWRADLGTDAVQVHTEWLHTPGNLTLSAYNSNTGNKPFASKRLTYQDSNVTMNREIAEAHAWTRSEIVARGESLAELACRIWPGPGQDADLAASSKSGADTEEADIYAEYWDAFLSGLKESGSPIASVASSNADTLQVRIGDGSSNLVAQISAGRSRWVGIILSLTGPERYSIYRALLRAQEDIEHDMYAAGFFTLSVVIGWRWPVRQVCSLQAGGMTILHAGPTRDAIREQIMYLSLLSSQCRPMGPSGPRCR
jgi:Protein of unknown function (DUF1524)